MDYFFQHNIDVFLYFGQLAAIVRTGGPLPDALVDQIREHKANLIEEITNKARKVGSGEKVSFDHLIEDRLQPDGTLRPPTGGRW